MKIYLAAFEIQYGNYQPEVPKDACVFLTYYYVKKVDEVLPQLKPNGHRGIITIDSGAHSFFGFIGISATEHIKKKGSYEDPEKYFARYLAWLKKNHKYFDYFVELDLQEIVGYERVLEWREEYKKAGIFNQCITVYHSADGWDRYEKLIENSESRYIGLEGLRSGKAMLPYNRYLKYAYEHDIRVHGFAFTKSGLLHDYPFYSVDSSSWTTAIRYGKLSIFKDGTIKAIDSNARNFSEHRLDVQKCSSFRTKEHCKLKLEHAAKAYMEMQDYFTKLWEKRGIHWKD